MFHRLAPLLKLFAAALLLLICLDAALFRSGVYARLIKFDSTAGSVVATQFVIERYYDPEKKNVLVLGNSQIGEGFSAQTADAATGSSGLHFVNGSVAGTTPRVWDYLLREVDPDAKRFAAIALMVDYDLVYDLNDLTNYPLDISYTTPLVRLSDLDTFPASFTNPELRARAQREILLPMQAVHVDIQDLLARPLRRIHEIRKVWPSWLYAVGQYGGRSGAVPPLDIDTITGAPRSWGDYENEWKPKLGAYFRDVRKTASPVIQQANEKYERLWLGRIVERYRARGIPVILFSMARSPWAAVLLPVPTLNPTLVEFRDAGKLLALPGDAFSELERPEFFVDERHLNSTGRAKFSQLFAAKVAPLVH